MMTAMLIVVALVVCAVVLVRALSSRKEEDGGLDRLLEEERERRRVAREAGEAYARQNELDSAEHWSSTRPQVFSCEQDRLDAHREQIERMGKFLNDPRINGFKQRR
jgi:FtsZ-interacting cell division protein ZipA